MAIFEDALNDIFGELKLHKTQVDPKTNIFLTKSLDNKVSHRILGSIVDKNIEDYIGELTINLDTNIFDGLSNPINSSNNIIDFTLKTQNKNTLLIAPVNGNGKPTFRKLLKEDLSDAQVMFTDHPSNIITNENIIDWNNAALVSHTHSNKSILDGTSASFTTQLKDKLDGLSNFILPIASQTVLGGIKVGSNLTINSDGVLSAVDTTYTAGSLAILNTGTSTVNSVWNAKILNDWLTSKGYVTTDTKYTSSNGIQLTGTNFTPIYGTTANTIAQGNDNRFHTHSNKSILDGTSASFTTQLKDKLDGLSNYDLPIASSSVLGGIKVGSNLTINSDGVLSATNTTYTAGSLATLNTGTSTVNSVWSAKILNDWLTSKDYSSKSWVNEQGFLKEATISTNYVPYTGATKTVDLNNQILKLGNNEIVNKEYQFHNMTSPGLSLGSQRIYAGSMAIGPSEGFQSLIVCGIVGLRTSGSSNLQDDLYLNTVIDQNNYEHKVILGATQRGTDRGQGIYDYVAVRGKEMIDWINAQDYGNQYVLPIASQTVLGGIKVGSNLTINSDGVLSATNTTYTAGTLAILQASNPTTVNYLWSSKNLNDWLTSKGYVTTDTKYTSSNGIQLTGTNFTPVYGTGANTIAQGNDTRILNGQIAYGWGDHKGKYLNYNPTASQGLSSNAIDFNNTLLGSFEAYASSASTNKPINIGGFLSQRYFNSGGVNYTSQIFNSITDNEMYFRVNNSVNTAQWNRIWHSGNLKDPATESWVNSQGFSKQTLTAGINIQIVGSVISATDTKYTSSNGIQLTGTNFTPVYGTGANTIAQGNDQRILNGQTAYSWGDHKGKYLNLGDNNIFTSKSINSDLNDQIDSVVYANGSLNRPSNINSTVVTFNGLINYGFQLAQRNENIWFRGLNEGVWKDWNSFWHSGNLINPATHQWVEAQEFSKQTLTAGTNIQITNNVISATDTTYASGTLALLNTGTSTVNSVWSAKTLSDYVTSKIPNQLQTLSLSTPSGLTPSGNISISDGNNIRLNSLNLMNYNDSTNRRVESSFIPYYTVSGNTSYPSPTVGGGIRYERLSSKTNQSGFYIHKTGGQDLLWYKTFDAESTERDWKMIADRDWVAAQGYDFAYGLLQSSSSNVTGKYYAQKSSVNADDAKGNIAFYTQNNTVGSLDYYHHLNFGTNGIYNWQLRKSPTRSSGFAIRTQNAGVWLDWENIAYESWVNSQGFLKENDVAGFVKKTGDIMSGALQTKDKIGVWSTSALNNREAIFEMKRGATDVDYGSTAWADMRMIFNNELIFERRVNNVTNKLLHITSTGNVGIGYSGTPRETLDVDGSLRIKSSTGNVLSMRNGNSIYNIVTANNNVSSGVLRQEWTANNAAYVIGGIGSVNSGQMATWGIYKFNLDRTANGNDGYFGFIGNEDQFQISNLSGVGDRMVVVGNTGILKTMDLPTTYTAGTLALLNTGTSGTNMVWSPKTLTDWGTSKFYNNGFIKGRAVGGSAGTDADTAFADGNGGFITSYGTATWLANSAFRGYGGIIDWAHNNGHSLQINYDIGHGTTDGGRIAFRTKHSTGFTPWKEFWHDGNLEHYNKFGIGTTAVNIASIMSDEIQLGRLFRNTSTGHAGSILSMPYDGVGTTARTNLFRVQDGEAWISSTRIAVGVLPTWKKILTEGDFNVNDYVKKIGDTMSGALDISVATQMINNSGVTFLSKGQQGTILANNVLGSSATTGVVIRPTGYGVAANQTLFSGDGFIRSYLHGDSSQWKQAYDWGDFRTYGLGRYKTPSIPMSELANETGFYFVSDPNEIIPNTTYKQGKVLRLGNGSFSGVVGSLIMSHNGNEIGYRYSDTGTTVRLWHSGNLTKLSQLQNDQGFVTTDTTYTAGTYTVLVAGTSTVNSVWSAKVLGDWLDSRKYTSQALAGDNQGNSVMARDSRSINDEPSTTYRRGVFFDFKSNSAIGLTKSGVGSYSGVMTMVPYSDASGWNNTTFRLAHNATGLNFQTWNGSWQAWKTVWDSSNLTNLSQLNNDQGFVTSDTTYSAGNGLTLSGTTFSLPITQSGSGNAVIGVVATTNGITVTKGNIDLTIPLASNTVIGGMKLANNTLQTVNPAGVTATASRTYAIQLNSLGHAVVNVPWTNTTYSAGTLAILNATSPTTTNYLWSSRNLNDWLQDRMNTISVFEFSAAGGIQTSNAASQALTYNSISIGRLNSAEGFNSLSIGTSAFNRSSYSTIIGNNIQNEGQYSSLMGSSLTNFALYGNMLGRGLNNYQDGHTIVGMFNEYDTTNIGIYDAKNSQLSKVFTIGIGTSSYDRRNGFVMYRDASAEFFGRAYYNSSNRNSSWFENEYTLVDVKYLREYVGNGSGGGSGNGSEDWVSNYGSGISVFSDETANQKLGNSPYGGTGEILTNQRFSGVNEPTLVYLGNDGVWRKWNSSGNPEYNNVSSTAVLGIALSDMKSVLLKGYYLGAISKELDTLVNGIKNGQMFHTINKGSLISHSATSYVERVFGYSVNEKVGYFNPWMFR